MHNTQLIVTSCNKVSLRSQFQFLGIFLAIPFKINGIFKRRERASLNMNTLLKIVCLAKFASTTAQHKKHKSYEQANEEHMSMRMKSTSSGRYTSPEIRAKFISNILLQLVPWGYIPRPDRPTNPATVNW